MKTFIKSWYLLLALIFSLSSCASMPGKAAIKDGVQVEVDSKAKNHKIGDSKNEDANITKEQVHNEDGLEGSLGRVENKADGLYNPSDDLNQNFEISPAKTDNSSQVDSKVTKAIQNSKLDNIKLGFNNEESRALRDLVENLGHSLIEDDNQELATIDNVNDLEAIVAFDNDMSYGWICKYADNKIGIAMIYHEVGQAMSPIVAIFGERALYESGSSGIMNNYKDRFIQEAEKLKLSFFDPGTNFIDLYN